MVTSNAVYNSLLNKVNKGIRIGADFGTSELTLEKGVYLYVTNEHPLASSRGLYLISVASTTTYNRVLTLISDSIVDSITISRDSTLFSVTSNSYFRGTLIKISDITAV